MAPVPIEASKENGVEVPWEAKLLSGDQSLAQFVRELLLAPVQILHVTNIASPVIKRNMGDVKNLLCSN